MNTDSLQKEFNKRPSFWVAVLLFFLGLAAYHNAILHPFVHDDFYFIHANPNVQDFNFINVFVKKAFDDGSSVIVNTYYRPLLEFFYFIQYKMFHLNPYGYHLFNIIIHIVNAWLVFMVCRLLFPQHFRSALAIAVLFCIHPVQTEAVACISGISNTVFALLSLSSLYCYLLFRSQPTKGRGFYVLSLVFLFLGFLAKEQSIVIPFIILLYEYVLGKKEERKQILVRWSGFFATLILYFTLRHITLGASLNLGVQSSYELWLRMLAVPHALLMYLQIIFFPVDLHYYRSTDVLEPFLGYLIVLCICLIAVSIVVWKTPKPYKQWMLFGLGWFAIFLLPVLNIIPIYNEYSFIMTAEHFLYMPLIGIIIFVISLFCLAFEKKIIRRQIIISLFAITTLIYVLITIKQNTIWQDEVALFRRTVQYQPNFGRVRFLLGNAYYNAGDYVRGLIEYKHTLDIMQGYVDKVEQPQAKQLYQSYVTGAYRKMITGYEKIGDFPQAGVYYDKLLVHEPENVELHNNAAINAMKLGDAHRAVEHFEQALELGLTNLTMLNNLAVMYIEIGDKEKAENMMRKILEMNPNSQSAKDNLKRLLEESNL